MVSVWLQDGSDISFTLQAKSASQTVGRVQGHTRKGHRGKHPENTLKLPAKHPVTYAICGYALCTLSRQVKTNHRSPQPQPNCPQPSAIRAPRMLWAKLWERGLVMTCMLSPTCVLMDVRTSAHTIGTKLLHTVFLCFGEFFSVIVTGNFTACNSWEN